MDSYNSPTTKPLFRGVQIVWYILGIIEAFLAFRFVLKLMEANASAGFTHFIYAVSSPFVAPFTAVFQPTYVSGSIFEWTTLLAMFVYWLIALALTKMFVMSKSVSTPEAAAKLNRQDM